MVLTKSELIAALRHEVKILLHLASKIEPVMLDYRPGAKQRSLLELLQYLVIFAPIHVRTITAGDFNMDAWRAAWQAGEATAKTMSLEDTKAAIGRHPALFEELISPCSDAVLRSEIEMFGSKASRGATLVSLVLCHYVAYRMQLFLYLKACGRDELSTMNLWAGLDA